MATEKTFEASIKRLEEIVRLLESGDVSLADMIAAAAIFPLAI